MNATFSGRDLIRKLGQIIALIKPKPQQERPSMMDLLHHEISHIEQNLVRKPRIDNSRDTRPLHPVTEQEKIIDLAG